MHLKTCAVFRDNNYHNLTELLNLQFVKSDLAFKGLSCYNFYMKKIVILQFAV